MAFVHYNCGTVYLGRVFPAVTHVQRWCSLCQCAAAYTHYAWLSFTMQMLHDTFSAFGVIINTPKIMRDPDTGM